MHANLCTESAGGTHGNGTVFRFAPVAMGGKAAPTLLYQFGANANDGIKPIDNVIKVGSTLYGMTVYGGASGPSPDDPSVTGSGTATISPEELREAVRSDHAVSADAW